MKSLHYHSVLVILTIFIIVEASLLNELNVHERNDHEGSNTLNVKLGRRMLNRKKFKNDEIADDNETSNDENKLISKLGRIVRTSLKEGELTNVQSEQHGDRLKRNATVLKEFIGAKKSYKKLKLSVTQAGYKNTKNKEGSNDFDSGKYAEKPKKKIRRRHVDGLVNDKDRVNSLKHHTAFKNLKDVKSDYYAKKKAIMDRFYTRQRQIEEKYAKKVRENSLNESVANVKTPTLTNIQKFSVNEIERGTNTTSKNLETNVTSSSSTKIQETTTTKPNRDSHSNHINQFVDNLAEDTAVQETSADYDYYTLEDNRLNLNPNAISEDKKFQNDHHTDSNEKNTLKWGDCKGRMMYQQNLIITADKAKQTDANITASIDGPYCITCARLAPVGRSIATVSLHKDETAENQMIVRFRNIQNQQLSYTMNLWAVDKKDNRCDY
ncbi:hypothetical protein ANTRET_LOCUS8099 [Anthophora retusa]